MFRLRERGTSVGAEVRGGLVTFLTLSYILFVQPAILSAAGMPHEDVFFATCVCSALACFLMGLAADYPFALAPAMGHNVFFVFTVCFAMGFTWQEALAANLMAGLAFVALSFFGFRAAIMHAVPTSLKYAIAVGIGLLIAFVGLQYGGVVARQPVVLVRLGNFASPVVLVTLAGIALTAVLLVLRLKGAVLLGIVGTAVVALAVTYGLEPQARPEAGLELIPAEHLSARQAGQAVAPVAPEEVRLVLAEWPGEFHWPRLPTTTWWAFSFRDLFTRHGLADVLLVAFIFFFLDLFDTVGTLIGVSERAGFLDADGRLPRARWALFSDAVGTVIGAVVGTSTITTYVESAAGVKEGARTGLAAIVTGLLLLASLLLAPLVQVFGKGVQFIHADTGAVLVQVAAGTGAVVNFYPVIAPVLVIIGVMMMASVRTINWFDYDEAIPAFLTIVVMQFSLSITDGIAWGFISYALLKVVAGRGREIHGLVALFAVLFVAMYVARVLLGGF
jgi:AGZA family xanthine/uracil permease-like MFS transporter